MRWGVGQRRVTEKWGFRVLRWRCDKGKVARKKCVWSFEWVYCRVTEKNEELLGFEMRE